MRNRSSLTALLTLALMIGGAASAQKNGHAQAGSAKKKAEIKDLYNRWAKAFEAGQRRPNNVRLCARRCRSRI
jgi:hypothetical protein